MGTKMFALWRFGSFTGYFDDRWISVSQGMRTDVLVRHPIYEELCNWSRWLWSHGEWLDLISRRFGLAWNCNFGMTALCYEEWFWSYEMSFMKMNSKVLPKGGMDVHRIL